MWEILHTKLKKKFSKGSSAGGSSASGSEDRVDSPANKLRVPVNFKDLNLSVDEVEDSDEEETAKGAQSSHKKEDAEHTSPGTPKNQKAKRLERSKLVIIMVGLPGRGKTWLCHKLLLYLNWLGHNTKHVNVGKYRRLQKPDSEVQNADFFDQSNKHGMEARNRALQAALDDLDAYLASDEGQIVIFDATNTTEERRQMLAKCFHGRYQYLFIESICNDPRVLEQNYVFKMKYSPDYQGVDTASAIEDFKTRIRKYEEVYTPMENRNVHYIKLIDMVTGRGYMDVNRISGYIPGKIVFFLMQVCKAGLTQARRIWLTRHGESEFNKSGKIGGDSSLSVRGEEYARLLPDKIIERLPMSPEDEQPPAVSVWTSTLKRTIETASFLPFPKLRWKALDEIQAGLCDGLTYAEIEERFPEEYQARAKDKLRYRYPAGESYLDVIMRLEPVVIEMEREKECICIVSHQAVLRAILGYFMGVPHKDIPTLDIPLHTIIELRPRPDGQMEVEHFPVHVPSEAELLQPSTSGPSNSMDGNSAEAVGAKAGAGNMPPNSLFSVTSKTPVKIPFGAMAVSSGNSGLVSRSSASETEQLGALESVAGSAPAALGGPLNRAYTVGHSRSHGHLSPAQNALKSFATVSASAGGVERVSEGGSSSGRPLHLGLAAGSPQGSEGGPAGVAAEGSGELSSAARRRATDFK